MKNTRLPAVSRLEAMLRRRGAALPESPDADSMAAIARCETCRHTELCDELLASAGNGGNRSFCPNTHYVEALRQRRLAFAKS
ncbi:MAG TPA: DUF6455 family protein [Burkholderiales bacterium]|jgi:hypothetical protein